MTCCFDLIFALSPSCSHTAFISFTHYLHSLRSSHSSFFVFSNTIMIPTSGPLYSLFPFPKQSFLGFPVTFLLLSNFTSKKHFIKRSLHSLYHVTYLFFPLLGFCFVFFLHNTFPLLNIILYIYLLVYYLPSSLDYEYKICGSRLFVFSFKMPTLSKDLLF